MLSFKNKTILPFILHSAGWALFIYLTIPHINRAERPANDVFFPLVPLTEYALLAIYFYLNISVFVPRLLSKKKIICFLGTTIAAFLLFCLVVPWFVRQYFMPFVHEAPFRPETLSQRPNFAPPGNGEAFPRIFFPDVFRRLGMHSRTSQFLIVFIISTGLKAISQWYAEKRRLQELEKSMVQAELSFLKSQIHPHFLFNSLNSIYYLALSKDDRAPEAILSLSDFLRFVTTESNHSHIPLEKEVKMLEEYIHLQSLRASEKFELQFRLEGDFREQEIMPLTFVPFVENAFKYGISAHIDCFIHVGIKVEGGALLFTCNNSIVSGINNRERSTGVGLENIRKRLELAYPGRHSLEINSDRRAFYVKLQINQA
ncbi:MAG: sensor histidine kinase [Tannerellaceae bacterium]|jgi:sensor histidine kinase YesM|nr:sensor histidine kinase [Tannerellaceae bacterium]